MQADWVQRMEGGIPARAHSGPEPYGRCQLCPSFVRNQRNGARNESVNHHSRDIEEALDGTERMHGARVFGALVDPASKWNF